MKTQRIEYDVHHVPMRSFVSLSMLFTLVLVSKDSLATQWPLMHKPPHTPHSHYVFNTPPSFLTSNSIFEPTNGPNGGWIQTNGPYGGYISCFAISDKHFFAGTMHGGVFRSTDNGATWVPVNTGLTNTFIYDLAVRGTSIFVATGNSICISTNNGESWSSLHTDALGVQSLAISSTALFAGSWRSGIFRSADNGITWTPINNGLIHEPGDPSAYGSVYSLTRSGTNLLAGTDNGGFLSTNSGESWSPVRLGATTLFVNAFATRDTNLFVGGDGGVYLSSDNGANWIPVNSGLTPGIVPVLVMSDTNLFAGTNGGIFRSTNNGTTWTSLGLADAFIEALTINGTNFFAGAWGTGVFRSTDSGVNWNPAGLTGTNVSALVVAGINLLAGTDYGRAYRSNNNGANWNLLNTGLVNTYVNAFAVSGMNLFAGISYGGILLSTDGGVNWAAANTGLPPYTNVTAIMSNGTNLFAGTSHGVFLSTNGGATWSPTGLTNIDVNAFAIMGKNLFAGTHSGNVCRSTDNGTTWTFSNKGLYRPCDDCYQGTEVYALAVCDTNLFAGTDVGGFRSTDNGTSWTLLPSCPSVNCLTASGTNLFAGTWGGIFLSTDNGTSWNTVNNGLAIMSVQSLTFSSTNLFAGIFGGGVWSRPLSEMVSIMSLRQANNSVSSTNGTVFTRTTNVGVGTLTWTTTSNDSWLSANSNRKDTIAVAYGANTSSSPRTGVLTVNSNAWNSPLTIIVNQASASSGTLAVTVQDAEDWGLAGANANVHLYSPAGALVGLQRTNASSVATFTNVPSGSGYYYTVEHLPSDSSALFGTLYWGKKTGITITLGQSAQETFTRNAPYAPTMTVFNSGTNVKVSNQIVAIGTPLRIELALKNPSYMGAESLSVKARVVLDTNKTLHFDVDMSSTYQTMPVGSMSTVSFNFTPQSSGTYYRAGALIAKINGVDIYTEGFTKYDQPFFTVSDRTSNVQEKALPKDFALLQNYPNPFNPSTMIRCELPRQSHVSLKVYSTLGQEIRTLIDGTRTAGVYEVRFDGAGLPSGMYIYRMKAGEFIETRRLLLIR